MAGMHDLVQQMANSAGIRHVRRDNTMAYSLTPDVALPAGHVKGEGGCHGDLHTHGSFQNERGQREVQEDNLTVDQPPQQAGVSLSSPSPLSTFVCPVGRERVF